MTDFSESSLHVARCNAMVFEHLSNGRFSDAQCAAERLVEAARILLKFAIAKTPSTTETSAQHHAKD